VQHDSKGDYKYENGLNIVLFVGIQWVCWTAKDLILIYFHIQLEVVTQIM
jgi:hypothetical protein